MSCHEQVAYVLGIVAGIIMCEVRPLWLMALVSLIPSFIGTIAGIILDVKEPFAQKAPK